MLSLILLYCLCFITPAFTKPRYVDLDEDDEHLFRAVFDAPSYDHEEYEEDLDFDKMDLLKDGLWVVKAKLAELRAFNKALVSNLLSTKLKLKDLMTNHLPKKHHHMSLDKKKPQPVYHHIPQYEVQPAHPAHDPYYGH